LSLDGTPIVYSAAGNGDLALLFVHGGMADRSFFAAQLDALAGRYRVIAVDLAGHGESGTGRKKWGIPEFGADVKSVVEAEKLKRVVLFGNSLGGPTVVEAALLLQGPVVGVVGIDTFQDLGQAGRTPEYRRLAAEEMRRRAEAFRSDYPAAMKTMVQMLFHPDADPKLTAEAERRMLRTPDAVAYAMLSSVVEYDFEAPVRRLAVPLRAINGDLYPTDVAAARRVKPDFDAIVMAHVGHYPMLEQPDEFNGHVAATVEALLKAK